MTKLRLVNSPSRGKIWTYLGCITVIFTTYYLPFQFLKESTTDHRKSKFCDPITQDSPLLSSLETSHYKNYGNNIYNTLSNYWPTGNLIQSLLHNSLYENHQKLILTSQHHNSSKTPSIKILPRQKIHSLSLKSQSRHKIIFLSHETKKFTNSSSPKSSPYKNTLPQHHTTPHSQPSKEIQTHHTKSSGCPTICRDRLLNKLSQLSQSTITIHQNSHYTLACSSRLIKAWHLIKIATRYPEILRTNSTYSKHNKGHYSHLLISNSEQDGNGSDPTNEQEQANGELRHIPLALPATYSEADLSPDVIYDNILPLPTPTYTPNFIVERPTPRSTPRFKKYLANEANRLLHPTITGHPRLIPSYLNLTDTVYYATERSFNMAHVASQARALNSLARVLHNIYLLRDTHRLFEVSIYHAVCTHMTVTAETLVDKMMNTPLAMLLVNEQNQLTAKARETMAAMTNKHNDFLQLSQKYMQQTLAVIRDHREYLTDLNESSNLIHCVLHRNDNYQSWKTDHKYPTFDMITDSAAQQLPMLYINAILVDAGQSLLNAQTLQFPVHIDDNDDLLGHRDQDIPHMKTYLTMQYLLTVARADAIQAALHLIQAQLCGTNYFQRASIEAGQGTRNLDTFHDVLRSTSHFLSTGVHEDGVTRLRSFASTAKLPWAAAPWSTDKDIEGDLHTTVTSTVLHSHMTAQEVTCAGAAATNATIKERYITQGLTNKRRQEAIKRLLFSVHEAEKDNMTSLPESNVQPILIEIRHKFPLSISYTAF